MTVQVRVNVTVKPESVNAILALLMTTVPKFGASLQTVQTTENA
jgi:hypothetical protein